MPEPYFQRLFREAHVLYRWLEKNQYGFKTKRNREGRYCFEIQRFHVWPDCVPISIQRFELLTETYTGPYCPILASRLEYGNQEFIVYEGYEFNPRRHDFYTQNQSFYFVFPAFLLTKPWPFERNWRWHPGVKVSQGKFKEILDLEIQYGGWNRNRRGTSLIPYQTGCSGKSMEVVPGQGWATTESLMQWSTQLENLDLFDASENHA